jgi:hypothetical protein
MNNTGIRLTHPLWLWVPFWSQLLAFAFSFGFTLVTTVAFVGWVGIPVVRHLKLRGGYIGFATSILQHKIMNICI